MTDPDTIAAPSSASNHHYTTRVTWTGNTGQGTRGYRVYQRTWDIASPGKPVVPCSNDPLLGGDPSLYNPEDLLLASVSACHMLWYLHLASAAGVVVLGYTDNPAGTGEISANGAGRFLSVTLKPDIVLASGSHQSQAEAVHAQIHQYCFIARSLNFPVHIKASYTISEG